MFGIQDNYELLSINRFRGIFFLEKYINKSIYHQILYDMYFDWLKPCVLSYDEEWQELSSQ